MSNIWKPLSKSLRVLNRTAVKKDRDDINQQTIRNLASNHEQVQQRIFIRWINMQLQSLGLTINSLKADLKDGHVLHALLSHLTQEKIQSLDKKSTRFHHVSNVTICLEFLEKKVGALPNIGSVDIVDGNIKLTLGLIWLIILRFQIQQALSFDPQSNFNTPLSLATSSVYFSGESTDSIAALPLNIYDSTATIKSTSKGDPKSFLLNWVQSQLSNYCGLIPLVRDFSCSWQSGLAFSALIHKFDPSLIPQLGSLIERASSDRDAWREVLETAFKLASEGMGISSLLEPDDILSVSIPDEKVIMMYVSEFYKVMSSRLPNNKDEIADSMFELFTKLTESISIQLKIFELTLEKDQVEFTRLSTIKPEDITLSVNLTTRALDDYQPTIQTMSQAAENILTKFSDSNQSKLNSIKDSKNSIMVRWDQLRKALEKCGETVEDLQQWGTLNYQIAILETNLMNIIDLCSEFMELKGNLSETEKLDRVDSLESSYFDYENQINALRSENSEDMPPKIELRFFDLSNLLLKSRKSLDQFQFDIQATRYKFKLNLILVSLEQKKEELKDSIRKSIWSTKNPFSTEIELYWDMQYTWKNSQGTPFLNESKDYCSQVQKLMDTSRNIPSSKIKSFLKAQNAILSLWNEIEYYLELSSILVPQARAAQEMDSKFGILKIQFEDARNNLSSGITEFNYESYVEDSVNELNILTENLNLLNSSNFKEARDTSTLITTYFKNNFELLRDDLLKLQDDAKLFQADVELNKKYMSLETNAHNISSSINKFLENIEGLFSQLDGMSYHESEKLLSGFTCLLDGMESKASQIDSNWQDWMYDYESLKSSTYDGTRYDKLTGLFEEINLHKKRLEKDMFRVMEAFSVGQHLFKLLKKLAALLEEYRILEKSINCAPVVSINPEIILSWQQKFDDLNQKRRSLVPTSDTSAFSYVSTLDDKFKLFCSDLDNKASSIHNLLTELSIKAHDFPFTQFCSVTNDYISAGNKLIELIRKTLFDNKLEVEDMIESIEKKSSNIAGFIKRLSSEIDNLIRMRDFYLEKLSRLDKQSESSLLKQSLDLHELAIPIYERCSISKEAAAQIYGQIRDYFTYWLEIKQIHSFIESSRSNCVELVTSSSDLNFNLNEFETIIDKKIQAACQTFNNFKEAVPLEFCSEVPLTIVEMATHNLNQLMIKIHQTEEKLKEATAFFDSHRKKASLLQTQSQIASIELWTTWCQRQMELLEDDRTLLRNTVWKNMDSSTPFDEASKTRDQIQNKLSQNLARFNNYSFNPSVDTQKIVGVRNSFEVLQAILTLQTTSLTKAEAISSHFYLISRILPWVQTSQKVLSDKDPSESSISAIEKVLSDTNSPLVISYRDFLTSKAGFDKICTTFSQNLHDIHQFIDPPQFEELVLNSNRLQGEWDQLVNLVKDIRLIFQVGEMCRSIHESIERLHSRVQSLNVVDINNSKRNFEALQEIDTQLKKTIFSQVRDWQTLVYNLPRDKADWQDKVKLTGELIDLLTFSIEDRYQKIKFNQKLSKLSNIANQLEIHCKDYLSTIKKTLKVTEKHSLLLSELEKSLLLLINTSASKNELVEDAMQELLNQASELGDSKFNTRVQRLHKLWQEGTTAAQELTIKLKDKITAKKFIMEKKLSQSKSHTVNKIPELSLNIDLAAVPSEPVHLAMSHSISEDSPNNYIPDLKNPLDVEVARVVNSYPRRVQVVRDVDAEKYWIGARDPKLCFCQLVRKTKVMVRIGGGWVELSEYLTEYCIERESRSNSRNSARNSRSQSRSQSRPDSSLGTIQENTLPPPPSVSMRYRSVSDTTTQSSKNFTDYSGAGYARRPSPLNMSSPQYSNTSESSPGIIWESTASYARPTVSSMNKARATPPLSRIASPSPRLLLTSPLNNQPNFKLMDAMISPRNLRHSRSVAFTPAPLSAFELESSTHRL